MSALALRLAYVAQRWPTLPDWNVDAIGYHQLAVNMLSGRGFSLNTAAPFRPDLIRTPGYPLLLAVIYLLAGTAPRLVVVAQCVLDSLTAVMVAGAVWHLTRRRLPALLSGLFYVTDAVSIRYCAELYVEIALGTALAGLCYLLAAGETSQRFTARTAALVGLMCGLVILIKPNMLPLPLIVAAYCLVRTRSARAAGIVLITSIALLTPWCVRNALTFKRPIVSSVFEQNLLIVSAPATLAEKNHETVEPWSTQWWAYVGSVVELAMHAHQDVLTIPESRMTDEQRGLASALLAASAREVLQTYPYAFVSSHFKGVFHGLVQVEYRFWFHNVTGQSWQNAMPTGIRHLALVGQYAQIPTLAAVLWIYFAARQALGLVLALCGIAWLWRVHRPLLGCWLAIAAYALILPGPISYERFTVSITSIACILMGLAAAWLHRRFGFPRRPASDAEPGFRESQRCRR
jgi:hypothetical protein